MSQIKKTTIKKGYVLTFYNTEEISKHTIGQVKWQKKRIIIKNIKKELTDIVNHEFEYLDDDEIDSLHDDIARWDGKTKLVLDSRINPDARHPIDGEPWGEGIPFERVIVKPVRLKEVKEIVLKII